MAASDFEPALLRTFISVAELGSFSRASEQLCLAQPTISLRIKRLEAQTGARLLIRHGQGADLTEEGAQLVRYAQRILALQEEAWSALGDPAISGPLRIGIMPDLAMQPCAQAICTFSRAHPNVRVEVSEGMSSELREALESGRLDLAILAGDSATPETRFKREQLHWIAAKAFAWQPDRPLPLVLCPQPCRFRELAFAALEAAGLRWRLVFVAQNLVLARQAVAAGLGVTIRGDGFLDERLSIVDGDLPAMPLPAIDLVLERSAQAENRRSVDALAKLLRNVSVQ